MAGMTAASTSNPQFVRHTNGSAYKDAVTTLLGCLPTCPVAKTLLSLVVARNMELSYQRMPEHTVYDVGETVRGQFAGKEAVPEPYRAKAFRVHPNDLSWFLYSHEIVATGVDKATADAYVDRSEGDLNFNYSRDAKTDWDRVLAEILAGNLDLVSACTAAALDAGEHRQFKGGRFHRPPNLSDILTRERVADLKRLCHLLDVDSSSFEAKLFGLHRCVGALEAGLGLGGEMTFAVDRRHKAGRASRWARHPYGRGATAAPKDTYKCRYGQILATDASRASLPTGLKTERKYMEAVRLVGVLRGRLRNMLAPMVSAPCLVIEKTGLSQFRPAPTDPLTRVFVCLAQAATSYQSGGLLGRWLTAYLDVLTATEARPSSPADAAAIFLAAPSPRTVALVPRAELLEIRGESLDWMKLMAAVMGEQWELGVKACAAHNMFGFRSGTTETNVNAWNACAGAWCNLLHVVRIVERHLEMEPSQLLKVLKLTARGGKWVDNGCPVFHRLTERGVMPWSGLTSRRDDFVEITSEICRELEVPMEKWFPIRGESVNDNL